MAGGLQRKRHLGSAWSGSLLHPLARSDGRIRGAASVPAVAGEEDLRWLPIAMADQIPPAPPREATEAVLANGVLDVLDGRPCSAEDLFEVGIGAWSYSVLLRMVGDVGHVDDRVRSGVGLRFEQRVGPRNNDVGRPPRYPVLLAGDFPCRGDWVTGENSTLLFDASCDVLFFAHRPNLFGYRTAPVQVITRVVGTLPRLLQCRLDVVLIRHTRVPAGGAHCYTVAVGVTSAGAARQRGRIDGSQAASLSPEAVRHIYAEPHALDVVRRHICAGRSSCGEQVISRPPEAGARARRLRPVTAQPAVTIVRGDLRNGDIVEVSC